MAVACPARPQLQLVAAAVALALLPALAAAQGAAEVAALMQIRNGFSNASTVLPDWSPTDASPCRWTGIVCNSRGAVTDL